MVAIDKSRHWKEDLIKTPSSTNATNPFQAGERKLAVIRKQSTPLELLMESIRSSESRSSLRKTSGPPARQRLVVTTLESSRCRLSYDSSSSPSLGKTVIQPDPDLMTSLLNFSDEDEEEEEEEEERGEELETVEETEMVEECRDGGDRKSCWRKQCEWRRVWLSDGMMGKWNLANSSCCYYFLRVTTGYHCTTN